MTGILTGLMAGCVYYGTGKVSLALAAVFGVWALIARLGDDL